MRAQFRFLVLSQALQLFLLVRALRNRRNFDVNKLVFLFGPLLLFVAMLPSAFGQDTHPRLEIFGGASYLPADGNDFPRENSPGFQAGIAANVNRWFSIAADFGAHYGGANTSVYQYLVGPRFTKRHQRTSVFVHALAGGATGRTRQPGFSDNGLTFGWGGGLDFHLTDRFAIRAIQFDYLGSFADVLEDNVRMGAGIVIKLGH
jgi:hypothetical protein